MLLIIAFAMFALLVVGWLVVPEKTAENPVAPAVDTSTVPSSAVPTSA